MRDTRRYSIILLFLFFLCIIPFCPGCGRSNIFDGAAKTEDYQTDLEHAQKCLDEGNYEKAAQIARDIINGRNNDDADAASQVLGQALLGSADLTVFDMVKTLTAATNPVSGNIIALNFVPLSKRPLVFEAATVLAGTEPEEKEVVLAKGIAELSAVVLTITTTFRPDGGNPGEGAACEPTANAVINSLWGTISPNITAWAASAVDTLANATFDKDLRNAAASINAAIILANTQMAIGDVSYANLLSFLGVL